MKEQVKSILTNSGHCGPTDLYPHLDKGNQDQIVILNMILEGIYPNGRENYIVFGSSQNTVKNQNSTNELPNMSLASKVIETESQKDDIVTVNLNTQDTQLYPKQNPMPKKVIETEAPKNDMVTVDLNTLDPKQNPMSRRLLHQDTNLRESRRVVKFRKLNPLGLIKGSSNLPTKLQIAKTLQLSHQIYHVTPQFLTLESLRVIVQKWF